MEEAGRLAARLSSASMNALLLFLVALGLAAEPLPKATPQEAGFSAERLARLDRVMRQ